jgi:CDP-diacylglycerol--serine O-phosphatidyltransferase
MKWPGSMFAVALYAGLTMVTNVPFYSFKDVQHEKERALCRDRADRAGHRRDQHPSAHGAVCPVCVYGLSGYVIYGWRKAKGQQTSVISTSTDEPDERGLHK